MAVEVHVSEVREPPDGVLLVADGELFKGHLRIYEVKSMAVAIIEAGEGTNHG